MRIVAALVMVLIAGCSVPSYSLRSSSPATLLASNPTLLASTPTLLASNDTVATDAPAPAAAGTRPIELVPSVRHGHSTRWKTGAAITFASLGVSLIGAAMTLSSLGDLEYGTGGNNGLFIAGFAISVLGDAGMAIIGPAVWMSAIGKQPD